MTSSDFSAAIRASAGYAPAVPPAERPVGSAGIGFGDAARPRPRRAVGMSALIRGQIAERHERGRELAEHESRIEELF